MSVVRVLPASLAGVALATVVSCAKPEPPKITRVTPRAVTVDATGLTVGVDVGMQNPNRVDLPLQAVTAHVVLDQSIDVGTVSVTEAVTLVAGKETVVSIGIPIAWKSTGQLAQLAAAGRDVTYKANGTVVLGGELLNVGVPFETSGTITRQQMLLGAMNGLPNLLGQ